MCIIGLSVFLNEGLCPSKSLRLRLSVGIIRRELKGQKPVAEGVEIQTSKRRKMARGVSLPSRLVWGAS